jgi:hypothetical protein
MAELQITTVARFSASASPAVLQKVRIGRILGELGRVLWSGCPHWSDSLMLA